MGLPARGKTHLAHAIQRYLRWLGVQCSVFNQANMRREKLGALNALPPDYFGSGEKATETQAKRRLVEEALMLKIREFFESGGQVAVYDANNTSQALRARICDRFTGDGIQVMFIGTSAMQLPTHRRMPLRQQGNDPGKYPVHAAVQSRLRRMELARHA